jgi:hypothetical protein
LVNLEFTLDSKVGTTATATGPNYIFGCGYNNYSGSGSLPFVQFVKNHAYYDGITESPYEAMFAFGPRKELALLSTLFLSRAEFKNLE